MTKQEAIRNLCNGQSVYTKVLIGRAYDTGYNVACDDAQREQYMKGWKAACDYCMRVCYAASVRALHQLEGYSTKRNRRFLVLMDSIVTDTLTSDDAIEAALAEAGVAINFREPFPEDRIQEVEPCGKDMLS